jgi:hypothetical protein
MPTARTAEERAHKAAYARAYRAKNRERLRAIRRAKEAANPERVEERRFRQWLERRTKPELVKRRKDRYVEKHRKQVNAYHRDYIAKHRHDINLGYQFRRFQLRLDTIAAYGGKCTCCGETQTEFLTIDHIEGDGAHERKHFDRSGQKMYAWLRRQGWPKDRYQLLCFNCNCAKGFYGQCPHQHFKVEEKGA